MRVLVYEAVCAGALGATPSASLLCEGAGMLTAIVEDLDTVAGVETVTLLMEPLSRVGRDCVHTPASNEIATLRDVLASVQVALVIAPETAGVLEQRSAMVLAAGVRLLGSHPDAIRITADKWLLAQHWHAQAIPTPATWLLRDAPFRPTGGDMPGPWVKKLRDGAGSQDMCLLRDLAGTHLNVERYIVQPRVPGLACSVALLVFGQQVWPLPPGTQDIRGEEFHYHGGAWPLPADLATRAIALATRAVRGIDGLQGWVGVDLLLGDQGDWAIEVNPRITTAYLGLRQLCQGNLANALLMGTGDGLRWHPGPIKITMDNDSATRG